MRKYDDLVMLAGKENTKENILFIEEIDSETKTYSLATLFGESLEDTFTDSDLVDFVPNYDKKTKEKLTFNYKEIADNMTGFEVIVEALQEEQEKMFNDMIKYSIYNEDSQFGPYLHFDLSKQVKKFNENHNLTDKSVFIGHMKEDINYYLEKERFYDIER